MTHEMPWFRVYSEVLDDRKIKYICKKTGHPKALIIGVWICILSIANDSPERGKLKISKDMRVTSNDIADETGLELSTVEIILTLFEDLGMLASNENILEVVNWDKRQFKSDNSTERVREHRMKRFGNVTPQPLRNVKDTDTDTESDTEADSTRVAAFAKFQNEIGMLTPRTNDMVGGWIDNYTDQWTCEAIDEAVKNNVRKPAYIDAILVRWKNEGKSNGKKPAKDTKVWSEEC